MTSAKTLASLLRRCFCLNMADRSATCAVEMVFPIKRSGNPFIVSFANGRLNVENNDQIQFSLYEQLSDNEQNKEKQRLLVAETANRTYINNNGAVKHCIGVLDKKTGKMKVYEANMYNLKPYFKDLATNDSEYNNSLSARLNKADELTRAFGSKKKNRAMESRVKNVIKAENLLPIMQSAVSETHIPEQSLVNKPKEDALVWVNWEAMTVQDVYDMDTIVKKTDLNCLEEMAFQLKNASPDQIEEWNKKEVYPTLILNILNRLKGIDENLQQMKLLAYLSVLMKLYMATSRELRKKNPLPDIPDRVSEKLLSIYTQSTRKDEKNFYRSFPQQLKDKLLAHIMVIGLVLNGYALELSSLRKIKAPAVRLRDIARMVGAKLNSKLSDEIYVSIPLKKWTPFARKKLTLITK